LHRLLRIGGQCHHLSKRVGDALLPHPVNHRLCVQERFGGRESLGRDNEQRLASVKAFQHRLQRTTIDVGDDGQFIFLITKLQRLMQHFRSKRRAANAKMNDLRKLAESARVDHLDQAFHPQVQRAGIFYTSRVAGAAFCAMFRCPSFTDINRFTGKQRVGFCRQSKIICQSLKSLQGFIVQMGF